MDFQCYIAMTAAEYFSAKKLPDNTAWMACHFSCYGTGLSNMPTKLPSGSMIIINDKLPPSGHDPDLIVDQLLSLNESSQISYILLDFQREGSAETAEITRHIYEKMDCPVGISEYYASCAYGPVFVSMPKPYQTLDDVLTPWNNREIWLEAAVESETAIIKRDSCRLIPTLLTEPMQTALTSKVLRSRYYLEDFGDHAKLTYTRDIPQLEQMISDAKDAGVAMVIGLYQQLGNDFLSKK